MKKIEVIKLQGRGLGLVIKGLKSKRERDYIIGKIIRASQSYRFMYKLRKCIGI